MKFLWRYWGSQYQHKAGAQARKRQKTKGPQRPELHLRSLHRKVPMTLSQIDITVIFFDSTVKDICPPKLIALVHEYIRQINEAE